MVNLATVAVAIKQARPNYAYGQLAHIDVGTTQSMLIRVGMPASIPPDAVITSATLTLLQHSAASGSQTVTLRRLANSFNMSRTTWNNAPGPGSGGTQVTKSSPAAGTLWSWDVTATVQAYVAGTIPNYGWSLQGSTVGGVKFRGSKAAAVQPVLVVEYFEPGDPPENLAPDGGAVSVAKPTLTFLVAPDTSAVQVQIATNSTTIDFDSGEIATDVGLVDLAATAFGGLVAGATAKLWRARTRGGTGLTSWSDWASLSRVAKPTVAVTSPGASSDDTSPPIQWSVSGGTQESWQVIVQDAAGKSVANSGRVTSTATTWTPQAVVKTEGATSTITVRVWDTVDRAITPGDPDYAQATSTFTLSASGGVTAPSAMTAANDGFRPAVAVTATAASAPDGWAVIRNGVRIYETSTPSTSFAWTDWSATPNKENAYRVARVVNGAVSSGSQVVAVVPRFSGIWLIDPEDGTAALILGGDAGSFQSPELAVVHQPIAGPPVRRVAFRPPASGSVSGEIANTTRSATQTHAASVAALYDFKSSPADRRLQLMMGDRSIPVNVGDITVSPLPSSGARPHSAVSFSWWQIDDVPWTQGVA
jgi:hypothetical protein